MSLARQPTIWSLLLHARPAAAAVLVAMPLGCAHSPAATSEHAGHVTPARVAAVPDLGDPSLPPAATNAAARIAASPRHGQWVYLIPGPVPEDSMRAWIVYPERSTKAPVVVVVHEIFGASTWVRAVADQLAADGYIAIVPDLLHERRLASPDSIPVDSAVAAVSALDPAAVQRDITAAARYAMAMPAALQRYAVIGFCWGGGQAFTQAARGDPTLATSVVYYGGPPSRVLIGAIHAPVRGFYGGNDQRVTATVLPTDSAMRAAGKTYEYSIFPGAGHGFLRDQAARNGANLTAAREAWPHTLAWLRRYLGA